MGASRKSNGNGLTANEQLAADHFIRWPHIAQDTAQAT